ncbi:MAG: hypothetical protein JRJ27_07590 [Deltaproteobacteria bacterium]|nr:hypothetical protein [Deltaproteobacteria bacterium]
MKNDPTLPEMAEMMKQDAIHFIVQPLYSAMLPMWIIRPVLKNGMRSAIGTAK